MSATEQISHPGIIDHVTNDSVFVKILAMSACSSCHAKGMCNLSEVEEKIVEVRKDPNKSYIEGAEVNVSMKKSLGGRAVLLGYIIPFLLLFGTLVAVLYIFGDEGVAGLSAILILIPYFSLLYIFRNKLKKTFSFSID